MGSFSRRARRSMSQKRARDGGSNAVLSAEDIVVSSCPEPHPLQQALTAQRREAQLCDITIKVEESSFRAHRCVLAACSDYMASLLTGSFADSCAPTISLGEMSADTFEAALAFCYGEHCAVPDEAALEALLAAAARLQIIDLRDATENALKQHLSASNCLSVWSLAESHSLQMLASAAQHVAARAFGTIATDASFTTLPTANMEALLHDRYLLADEPHIFHAVVAWLKAQPDAARTPEAVATVMERVRFGLLPLAFLQTEVNVEPLMQSAPALKIINQCMMEKAHGVLTTRTMRRTIWGTWDISGLNAVSVTGETVTIAPLPSHVVNASGERPCTGRIVPAGEPITEGTHEFRFKLNEDDEDEQLAVSGFGFVSLTASRDNFDPVFDSSPEGLWWLRRYEKQVYSSGRKELDGEPDNKVGFPVGAEVRMVLDMDKGEATFFVDGTKLLKKATGITGPVRPCGIAYGDDADDNSVTCITCII